MEKNPKPTPENNSEERTPEQEEYFRIIKPLRTYERDLAEHVRNTNASKTEVNLREQEKKREKPQKESHPKKERGAGTKIRNVIAVVLVILIIISVGGLIFSVYGPDEKKKIVEEVPIVETQNFIVADQDVKQSAHQLPRF